MALRKRDEFIDRGLADDGVVVEQEQILAVRLCGGCVAGAQEAEVVGILDQPDAAYLPQARHIRIA